MKPRYLVLHASILGLCILGGFWLKNLSNDQLEANKEVFGANGTMLTELTAITTPTSDDLFYVVDAPATNSGTSNKITFANLSSAVSTSTQNSGNFCLADGTNCQSVAGGSQTLAGVTQLGASATTTLALYGGAAVGGTLTSTGTASLQTFTSTHGTSTGLFSTALGGTNLSIATLAALPSATTIDSKNVCLADGTNCAPGGFIPQLTQVLNAGRVATTTPDFQMGLTGTTSTVVTSTATGNFVLPDGASGLPGMVYANDVNTGFYRCGSDINCLLAGGITLAWDGITSSLRPTTDIARSVGTPSVRWLTVNALSGAFTSVSSTNVTSTHGDFSTTLRVGGVNVCLLDGTNCPASSGGFIPQLTQVLNAGRSATTTPTFDMGFTATTGTITNATTTNLDVSTRFAVAGQSVCLADGTNCPAAIVGTNYFTTSSNPLTIQPIQATAGIFAVSSTWTNSTTTGRATAGSVSSSRISVNPGSISAPSIYGVFDTTGITFGTHNNVAIGTGIAFVTGGQTIMSLANSSPGIVLGVDGATTRFNGIAELFTASPTITLTDTTAGENDFRLISNTNIFTLEDISSPGTPDWIQIATGTNLGFMSFPRGATSSFSLSTPKLTATSTVIFSGLAAPAAGASYVCVAGDGVLSSSTSVCVPSADKYKMNQKPLDLGLSTIMGLEPIDYDWNPETSGLSGHSIGIRADSAEQVDERLVTYNPDGTLRGFKYDVFAAVLTKGIQELNEKNQEQDKRIQNLERENTELKLRLDRLERSLKR